MADSLEHDFPGARAVDGDDVLRYLAMRSAAPRMLREHGIHSVYVVTQAWHMRRAILAFQRTGITVTAAPGPARPDACFYYGFRAECRWLAGQLLRRA